MAFDKTTGDEVWRAINVKETGYSLPTMIEHVGRKQLIVWYPVGLSSLDPLTGKLNWSGPLKEQFTMAIVTPRQQ